MISTHPSERKAFVSIGGHTKKVVFQTTKGVDTIAIDGETPVALEAWLAGKAELKGLQAK